MAFSQRITLTTAVVQAATLATRQGLARQFLTRFIGGWIGHQTTHADQQDVSQRV